jgi:hypothetical protein
MKTVSSLVSNLPVLLTHTFVKCEPTRAHIRILPIPWVRIQMVRLRRRIIETRNNQSRDVTASFRRRERVPEL